MAMLTEEQLQSLQDAHRCAAITKNGARCSNGARSNGYCGNHSYKKNSGERKGRFKRSPAERAARKIYSQARMNAKARGIPFELEVENVVEMVMRQGPRCAVTRVEFDFSDPVSGQRRPHFPSIDRINSNKGYTTKNCRIVTVFANLAMNKWGAGPLLAAAEAMRG